MKQSLVTVYITNYNYELFIRESIQSVLNQNFQDFELLIIDDGSTDNSKLIIEEYRNHPKIKIIYQQNKGLNVTNNIAMRASNSKYIIRLDADDFLEENALEIMTSILESDEELGLVFPDYYYVNKDGEVTGQEIRHNFDKEVSLLDQPAHGACTMIRLDFLKKLGGYNESFTCQDGYDLWIKFIMHYKVTNVNIPLFSYRRHGSNLTSNEDKILETRKKIKDTFIDHYNLKTPSTIAIIPVRSTYFGEINWPLYSYKNATILERIIQKAIESTKIQKVVVTTSEKEILDVLNKINIKNEKFMIVERPDSFAGFNESLFNTFNHVLNKLGEINFNPEAIMSLAIEFPFISRDMIDDAINTLTIFKSDSLLSLRPDNRMYYQHIGHGMKPILDQDKFTKLEREAIYKGVGGIVVSTVDNFIKNKKMVSGKVGHIIVEEKHSIQINSKFNFEIFKLIQDVI